MQVRFADIEPIWEESWIDNPEQLFYETLTAKWRAARALNAGGSLSNLSRNSSSHGYATPGPHTRTTVDLEDIAFEARKLCKSIAADLAVAMDEENEAAIYAEGIARFAASKSREYHHDFSLLRA